jgi:hypothetical protein
LQHNYAIAFKVFVGKIGQVLDIEASNLAIKQPTTPFITLVDINDPIDAIVY